MKELIKKAVSGFLYNSNLFRLSPPKTRILAFHRVNPKYFEKQVLHMVKNYKIIPLNKIFSSNNKSVAVTFDDGYKNNLEYAYPVLKKYNVPATIFIVYDFIDKNLFTWWDRIEFSRKDFYVNKLKNLAPEEIEEKVVDLTGLKISDKKPVEYDFMSWNEIKRISDVFEIGSHTLTHPILTNIPLKDAENEIYESKKRIQDKIGKKVISFAYPNGNYNEDIMKLVSKSGYEYAAIYKKGNNKPSDVLNLFRRGININDNLEVFATKVAGVF